MSSYNDASINQQYVFGDFVLHSGGTLSHREQQTHVPPKELAVLIMLLNSAGELVSKDSLLNQIWAENDVNEESLTRCIYALRRLLLESKNCRYIDTVYGKGYRFSRPVAVVSQQPPDLKQCSIAIMPFQTHPQLNAVALHHELVQGLSQYSPFGLAVFPTTITQHCHDLVDILALIDLLKPDYYLAGQTVPNGDNWKVRIELIRASDHRLVYHENIEICSGYPMAELQNRLASVLPRHIPELNWNARKNNEIGSLNTAIIYLNAQHELKRYTPSSLQQALFLLRQCVAACPEHSQLYCSLAECYLTMSQLGLFDQQQAITLARQAANKAVELAPDNPQALGLLALLSCMHSEHSVAKALFKQAKLLAPDSIDLYYYQAWALLIDGNLLQAQQSLNECIKRDPTYIAASVLSIWLTYFDQRMDDAVDLANKQLCQYGQDHPVLQSVQALLLALQGKHTQAEKLIQAVRASGEAAGLLAVNLCYADYCRLGDSALPMLKSFLSNIDCRQVRASLLPLIEVVQGRDVALQYGQQLLDEDYVWIKVWRHDHRICKLMNEINSNRTEAA